MVYPLKWYTKKLGEERDRFGAYSFFAWIAGARQRPPYTVNTNFERYWTERSPDSNEGLGDCQSWGYESTTPPYWASGALADATNGARKKFVNKLGDASSFGATMTAERKETWGTVVSLVTKALLAARQIKSLRFAEAARTLGVPYREYRKRVKVGVVRRGKRKKTLYDRKTVFDLPSGRTVVKTAASGWLLYSYGVKPLCEDIYNGMDILQRPIPDQRFRGSGRGNASTRSSDFYSTYAQSYDVSVRFAADVSVENPNLWLANKMGLINPAQWVLEAIPFSFVADWFSNLSDVVNAMSDLAGLKVTNTMLSRGFTSTDALIPLRPNVSRWHKTRVYSIREFGVNIPSVQLTFGYERFSWQRGLNAISLLVGFLPRK